VVDLDGIAETDAEQAPEAEDDRTAAKAGS
jgi:hypothetical protein